MAQQPFISYTIRGGDTHAGLAQQFGITEEALRAQLGALTPGRPVRIQHPPGSCPQGAYYALQRTDTLHRVAQRAGVTMKRLLNANPYLNPAYYVPGQVILIPAIRNDSREYTLQPGERLFDVLRRYRLDISTFCALNPDLKLMNVRPGDAVRLPENYLYDD